VTDRIELKP